MKNKEKYADEILNLFIEGDNGCEFKLKHFLCNKECCNCDTELCTAKTKEWLEAEYEAPKTRQSEFLKMFPTTKLRNGIVNIFPCNVDKSINDKSCIGDCDKCRKDFWLEEIE